MFVLLVLLLRLGLGDRRIGMGRSADVVIGV